MHNRGTGLRRVLLTPRRRISALAGLLVVLCLLQPLAGNAASGVDDYPASLKNARQDSVVDPWRFYNRECTSFVAWRLNSENIVPFNNYFLGAHWGNASNWRNAATSVGVVVDGSAVPGAVAWWSKGSAGSSRGHVAWVESVSGSSITIEEYNYLHEGRYDTRTIDSSSSLWPSGFIHIEDTGVRNVVPPTLIGTPQVGVPLRLSKGTWKPGKATYTYLWRANGHAIPGATGKTFTPTATELGQKIRVVVTATRSGFQTTRAKTPKTRAVARGVFTTPAPPTVSGTPQVGTQLSATTGTWSSAAMFSYRWYADNVAIRGATASTFTPGPSQIGHALTVQVTATAAGYTTGRSTSPVTTAVTPGQFTPSGPPTISGTPQVDQPLSVTAGTFTPSGTLSYQWLADGAAVSGATGTSYTPTPADLHKQITVQVSVARAGYQTAVTTSAASAPVAAGTFLNTQAPSVQGAAKVGVALTANPGAWSPAPTLSFQWLADGAPLADATGATYTPTPADLGHTLSVQVTATRDGYLTAVTSSPGTDPVAPGDIASTAVPTISGAPVVGATLTASAGTWSPTPDLLTYQWYVGPSPVDGATGATYQPTATDAGLRITVQVTATAAGYQPRAAVSVATGRVSLGQAGAASRPRVSGKALVGHTLRARVGTPTPGEARISYRWLRGGKPIRHAHTPTYRLRAVDVGKRLRVQVTVRASHWTTGRLRSERTPVVRSVPVLTTATTFVGGRVHLRLDVRAPGLDTPRGTADVREQSHRLGTLTVVRGHGTLRLEHLAPGRHVLTVTFRGSGPLVAVREKVVVHVP